MKLDANANAVATLAKVSDLIEQWHEEALDRYAWEVNQRDEDMRVLITARAVREQLEQCVAEMRAIVGWLCNGDGDVAQGQQRGIAA
jgi:division protein CdvB (Snf7/Vps24/ESCRT-III family)